MIVRTYGRRSRGGVGRAFSGNDTDPFAFDEDDHLRQSSSSSYYNNNNNNNTNISNNFSQETLEFQDSSQDAFNFTFSSQDSTRFFDSPPSLQLLRPIKDKKSRKLNDGRRVKVTTLMETQECGEMMECIDEVELALDGLKKGQTVRVRRASFLALLTVCGSSHQRRLLRAHGMTKTIIDAILDISLDDSPSNLAAATLFNILANDTQDNSLIDSTPSIRFLLNLLKPIVPETTVDKVPSISQKLLALGKDILVPQDLARKIDSSSADIVEKVLETLVSCKDLSSGNVDKYDKSRPELKPDWVSLLTMEKACLSKISIEDTTGSVRKTGGNFKDKLRNLGGLDAVFELALKFHSTLEELTEQVASSSRDLREGKVQCLPLLLKCLKIMENATFLSKENQTYLLGLKGHLAGLRSSLSFVKLMVSFIKILSELSLRRTLSATSSPEMLAVHSNEHHFPDVVLNTERKVDNGVISTCLSQQCASSQRSFTSESRSLPKSSRATPRSWLGNCLIEISSSSGSDSCNLTSNGYDSGSLANGYGSNNNMCLRKESYDKDSNEDVFIDLDDSQDPFAFDEDDYAPSKWDKLPVGKKCGQKQRRRPNCNKFGDMSLSHLRLSQEDCLSQPMLSQEDGLSQPMLSQEDCLSQPMMNQDEIQNDQLNGSIYISSDTSCTTIDEEDCNLVADCLLTTIRVLMNLTNDNSLGCQQIASCGGLETLSFLIARHFPSCSSFLSGERKENTSLTNIPGLGSQKDVYLNDQELDFLVTILGLLVNLVENDGDNRSRLAAAEISVLCDGESSKVQTGVIPLLCSIFLANRGAGETAEEELQSCDNDEVVLQGEKEAEKMIVEAYAALLLAFLSTASKSTRKAIANYLPDRNLKVLVPVLDRFVTFHLTLNMISPETHKTVSEVIESCRIA